MIPGLGAFYAVSFEGLPLLRELSSAILLKIILNRLQNQLRKHPKGIRLINALAPFVGVLSVHAIVDGGDI